MQPVSSTPAYNTRVRASQRHLSTKTDHLILATQQATTILHLQKKTHLPIHRVLTSKHLDLPPGRDITNTAVHIPKSLLLTR